MKTILITGASHGIGKAIAEKLAACGMRLFLNCRSSKETLYEYAVKLSETYHVPCTPLFYDVSDHKQVHAMFEEICALGESIDILINNAGISHIGLLQDMSIEEWNQVLNTNLTSAFSCSKYAIPDMITRKQGKIINISSIWGCSGASCEVAYSASKGGGADGHRPDVRRRTEPVHTGTGQGTCPKQYPGKCHRLRCHRYPYECLLRCGRTIRTGK